MLELTVDRPANGGEAVGRVDGRVVFVRGAIPGETVRAWITDDGHPSFWRAEVVDVIEPSPHRVAERCPAAAHGAGCCDLAFVDADYARSLKRDVLLDVAHRVGHLSDADLRSTALVEAGVEALADEPDGWRVRTRLAVGADGIAGQRAFRGDAVIGGRCIAPVAGLLDDIGGGFQPRSELVVVSDDSGGRHITELAPIGVPSAAAREGTSRNRRRRAQQSRHRRRSDRAERVLEGAPVARHRVGTRTWQIPVTGFWQAHRDAPAAYACAVTDFVTRQTDSAPLVWDLYGGAGVFAGTLLDQPGLDVRGVHIVDSDAGALAAADETFGGDERVRTHRGEVASLIGTLPAPDVVVLDPPRTGAGDRVIAAISAADPRVIVHVGCDAARFARDLGLFAQHGYRIAGLRGFDAFPLTHHVEAIACLVRSAAAG